MSNTKINNNTRYSTKDLQALVDFCVANAEPTGGYKVPDEFHFFEFRPRPKVATYRVNRFALYDSEYNPEYLKLPIQYAKSVGSHRGVIWLAAPETWLPQLAQLTLNGQEVNVPPHAIQHIADRIKSFWHWKNVPAPLPTSLHVSMVPAQNVTKLRTALLKRQKFTNIAGDFVSNVHSAVHSLRNCRASFDRVVESARTAVVPGVMADVEFAETIGRMLDVLAETEDSIKSTLETMRKHEEGK